MPSERFHRLPSEKVEAIRMAAIREFKRVPPEEASINRIIRDAEISRGSFYTYFTDKHEILQWLIGDMMKKYRRFYVKEIVTKDGDIWAVFDEVLDACLVTIGESGLIEIIGNIVRSSYFSEYFRKSLDGNPKLKESNLHCSRWIYQRCDKNMRSMDEKNFHCLMEMHVIILVSAMRIYFKEQAPLEEVRAYYRERMNLIRYGAEPRNGRIPEEKSEERQNEVK